MARHARRVPLWGLRRAYRALWLQYTGLLNEHESLRAEYELLLRPPADDLARQTDWGREHEDVLQTAEIPVITSLPRQRPVPSWAQTEPLPFDATTAYLAEQGYLVSASGTERAQQGIAD